jgi:hypothetical protein
VEEVRRVVDPDGREVAFDHGSWLHLAIGRRPEMLEHVDAALAAVALPDHREHDPIAGRERFYARHPVLPTRWLRVIVDFNVAPAPIVTVLVDERDPRKRAR